MLAMPALLAVLRSTGRAVRQEPGFFLLALLTLGVGIGAAVAMFTVVNSVLLQPLPYPDAARIVAVQHMAPGMGMDRLGLSDGAYLVYRDNCRACEALAIYREGSVTLTGAPEPVRVADTSATASLFQVLRTPPALGRTLQPADERPGVEPVVVLADELWRRRFGGDPAAVGGMLQVDRVSRRIVGVMPAGFQFPAAGVQLWLPLTIDAGSLKPGDFRYSAVARLARDGSPQQAGSELTSLVPRLVELPRSPITRSTLAAGRFAVLVQPLRDAVVGNVMRILWLLLGCVALILLIACANVANLLLVRIEKRQREVAVRAALGATRGDIVGLFLAESVALALVSGVLGLALGAAGVRLLVAQQPQGLPRLEEIHLNGRVVIFSFVLSVLSGLLAGALAAFHSGRPALAAALKEGGRGGSAGREQLRARNLLVVAQIALALILLAAAGLMTRSFWRLHEVDPGLDPHGVLTTWLDLPPTRYRGAEATSRFVVQLLAKVRAIPGVQSAGTTTLLPLAGRVSDDAHMIEDFPPAPGALPPVLGSRWVSPGYFATLRAPLVSGRAFDRLDPAQEGREVVVNAALAQHFWPGSSALGKHLSPRLSDPPQWYTIVGVVGNMREAGVEKVPAEAAYYPMQRRPGTGAIDDSVPRSFALLVRGSGDPLALAAPVREAVRSLDPDLPLSRVEPMADVVARSMVRTTFTTFLMLVAAAVALSLGAVGIYGVISYAVSQRTREIGVRIALGARRQDIAGLVLREGLLLTLAGIVTGLVGTVLVTRLMVALLFGVNPTDPATLISVSALLAIIALGACYMPAMRAAAVEPLAAMRSE